MSFQPSEFSGPSTMKRHRPAPPRRRGAATPLRTAIERTRARIGKERGEIRKVKAEILTAAKARKPTPVLRTRLHSLEWALHRDHHLLGVLTRALTQAQLAAALAAEKQAHSGVMVPKVTGYPAPASPPPAEKTETEVVQEATAEAADPKAADVHDAEAADVPADQAGAMVAVEVGADTNVTLFKRPIFWFAVGLGGVCYWQRDNIVKLIHRGA